MVYFQKILIGKLMSFLDCLSIKSLIGNSPVQCRKLYKFLFWTTLSVVFYFALSPHTCVGPNFENTDKYKHILAFFVLTNFFIYAYKKGFKLAWFWMFALGAFIEIVQYFIPTRESSIFDILADAIGVFLATIFIWIEKRYFKLESYKKENYGNKTSDFGS